MNYFQFKQERFYELFHELNHFAKQFLRNWSHSIELVVKTIFVLQFNAFKKSFYIGMVL